MGWTFYHKRPGVRAVDSIREHCFGEEWSREHVVAMTATREAVFAVIKRHAPDSDTYVPDADGTTRELAVIKIRNVPKARDGYNFGYKDMSETMGPVGCEAPLSILAQCSALQEREVSDDDYSGLRSARDYRARCKAKAEVMAFKRSLKHGDVVTLAKPLSFAGKMLQTFTVTRARVNGRRGISTVFCAPSGMLCGITANQLTGATVSKETKQTK